MNTKKRSSKGSKILFSVVVVLALANSLILVTGNTYLYRAFFYNFANIDDNTIFEQRKIEAGTPDEWPLSSDYNKALMPARLLSQLEDYKSIAFLIVQNDSLRYEKYWDGYGPSSLSNSFSMAKSFVGILTGIALDEGKISSLDQPVGDFLPEFRVGGKEKITVRHLLTMCSGLNWVENYGNPFCVTTEAYYGKDLHQVIASLKVQSEPGKIFTYSSGDTQILSFVVSKAVGMSLSDYASKKLWKQVGAVHGAEWSLDHKDGDEKGYCCVYSNARDFARMGQLFLKNGNWKGKQVVSEAYVRASIQPAPLKNQDGSANDQYGYSWWLLPHYKGHDIFYARGINGQYIFVVPDKNMVVVRLGKKRTSVKQGYHPVDVFSYIDGALAMVQ